MQLKTKKGKIDLAVLIDEQGFKKETTVTSILENMQTIVFDNGELVKTFHELEDIIVEAVQVVNKAKNFFRRIRDFFNRFL